MSGSSGLDNWEMNKYRTVRCQFPPVEHPSLQSHHHERTEQRLGLLSAAVDELDVRLILHGLQLRFQARRDQKEPKPTRNRGHKPALHA